MHENDPATYAATVTEWLASHSGTAPAPDGAFNEHNPRHWRLTGIGNLTARTFASAGHAVYAGMCGPPGATSQPPRPR